MEEDDEFWFAEIERALAELKKVLAEAVPLKKIFKVWAWTLGCLALAILWSLLTGLLG